MIAANIVRSLPSVYGPISKKFIREVKPQCWIGQHSCPIVARAGSHRLL